MNEMIFIILTLWHQFFAWVFITTCKLVKTEDRNVCTMVIALRCLLYIASQLICSYSYVRIYVKQHTSLAMHASKLCGEVSVWLNKMFIKPYMLYSYTILL